MFVQYHFDSYRKSFKARNQLNFKSDTNYIHLKKFCKFHNVRQNRFLLNLNVLEALEILTYEVDLLHMPQLNILVNSASDNYASCYQILEQIFTSYFLFQNYAF